MSYKAVLLLLATLTVALIVILGINTLLAPGQGAQEPPCTPDEEGYVELSDEALERFRAGIRFKSVTNGEYHYEEEEMERLVQFIIANYPSVHSSPLVTWQRVANHSLLYALRGSAPRLKPYLLMAHLDVVPADPAQWEEPPFSAALREGCVYGRGTIDVKQIVFGILEALEAMLKRGFAPKRSFYIAFGHDEEASGFHGAAVIAEKLKQDGVEFEFILDEGLVVLDGMMPGISKPVALVGTSEKGYLSLQLSVNMTGGHSSMPGKETSIGVLARAVARLEENPHKNMFGTGPEIASLQYLAPEMSGLMRVIMSNIWLFGPIVSRVMAQKPATNAQIRTTTAVTMFNAGVKENVLAAYAEAVVNHRIHPSQSVAEVIEYDRVMMADARVQVKVLSSLEPARVSPHGPGSIGYSVIKQSIRQAFSNLDVLVAPGLMTGNTDTRHYLSLSDSVYRFSPTLAREADLTRLHGVNERIALANYAQTIHFYAHVIVNADRVGAGEGGGEGHRASHEDF